MVIGMCHNCRWRCALPRCATLGCWPGKRNDGVFVSDSADAANLPTPFVALYGVDYPSGMLGRYYTTAKSTCSALANAWDMTRDRCAFPRPPWCLDRRSDLSAGDGASLRAVPTDRCRASLYDGCELYQLLQRVSGYRGEGLGWCACGNQRRRLAVSCLGGQVVCPQIDHTPATPPQTPASRSAESRRQRHRAP